MAKPRGRGNGEGTIYKIESKNLWACQYTLGRDEAGKLKRKTIYGKTRKDVKEKLEQLIADINGDKLIDKSEITVAALAKELIENDYKLNHLSSSTYNRKNETWKIIKKHVLGDTAICRADARALQIFFESITGYSNSVISKTYDLLNKTFKTAVIRNIIRVNPIERELIKKPKSSRPDKKVSAFSLDEQKRLIKALREDQGAYMLQILMSLFTGARMGEINALQPKDIDFQEHRINISKTITKDEHDKPILGNQTKTYAGIRTIPLNKPLEKMIKDYINERELRESEMLFTDKNDRLLTTSQVNLYLKRLCQKYNINKGYNVNQHMLRHTFATRCIESGMPASVLQKILGHTDISTTINTYCDIFAEYERKQVDRTEAYLTSQGIFL